MLSSWTSRFFVKDAECFKAGVLHAQLGQDELALECFDKARQEKAEIEMDGLVPSFSIGSAVRKKP
jgi:hypothetical protein